MSTILDLQPASVWHYFHQLTQIPRPSHHEEAVQQYVLDEAARLGLSAERDAVGNIRVRKPASAGHEGAPYIYRFDIRTREQLPPIRVRGVTMASMLRMGSNNSICY